MYDTIVIGLGIIGATTARKLALNNQDVIAFDKGNIPNPKATSYGTSRIFRLAYHEGDTYVPLLQDSLSQWKSLDRSAENSLIHNTGSLTIGLPQSRSFSGAKNTCESSDLAHEVLTGSEITTRFSGYNLTDEYRGVWQPDGHLIDAEKSLVTIIQDALSLGVNIHGRESVLDWEETDSEVCITTTNGTCHAENLVITSGAWASEHVHTLGQHLTTERHVACRFNPPNPESYSTNEFPVFVMDTAEGKHFYGLPQHRIPGIKVGGTNTEIVDVNPDSMSREARSIEQKPAKKFTQTYLSEDITTMGLKSCILTHSPDGHFIIDSLPEKNRVYAGIGMSGHGFKLAPTIGDMLTELVQNDETTHNRDVFRATRF